MPPAQRWLTAAGAHEAERHGHRGELGDHRIAIATTGRRVEPGRG
jgi:hypothetical protein